MTLSASVGRGGKPLVGKGMAAGRSWLAAPSGLDGAVPDGWRTRPGRFRMVPSHAVHGRWPGGRPVRPGWPPQQQGGDFFWRQLAQGWHGCCRARPARPRRVGGGNQPGAQSGHQRGQHALEHGKIHERPADKAIGGANQFGTSISLRRARICRRMVLELAQHQGNAQAAPSRMVNWWPG